MTELSDDASAFDVLHGHVGFDVAQSVEESDDGKASVLIEGEVVVLNAPMFARVEGRGADGRRRVEAGLPGFEQALAWAVAYADGNLDKYEEALIRQVAELTYVPHQDYIRCKLDAASA